MRGLVQSFLVLFAKEVKAYKCVEKIPRKKGS